MCINSAINNTRPGVRELSQWTGRNAAKKPSPRSSLTYNIHYKPVSISMFVPAGACVAMCVVRDRRVHTSDAVQLQY